jgi:hypothetical protein
MRCFSLSLRWKTCAGGTQVIKISKTIAISTFRVQAMKFQKLLVVAVSTAFLAACGGGGGGGTPTTTTAATPSATSASVTYTAAATPGELVTYTVDPGLLTYSYTITESQYGLTGQTGTGTLTSLGNNGYSLSGIPSSRIQILPNGLMLGAIRHNFGSGVKTVPVMGLSNPVSSLASVAGTYNYIGRGCVANACGSVYGTLQINSAGSWSYCSGGNSAATTPSCNAAGTGNLTSLGNGKFAIYDGSTIVGTMVAMASSVSGQNVVIIDLKDSRTTAASLGKGILVASSQVAVNTALTNGSWFAAGSDGTIGTFNTSGGNISYTSMNGASYSGSSTITFESPWTGIGSNANGKALLAGFGVYLYAANSGYVELGLKYN